MLGRRSLRTQILTFFLAGLAIVAVLAVLVFYVGGSRLFEAWLIEANQRLATSIRRQLEHGLAHGTDAAQRLGRELELARADRARRMQLLEGFLAFGELFSNAYVFRRDGTLAQMHYRPGQRATTARHGEDYHRYAGTFAATADTVLANGKPTFTQVYFTPSGRAQLSYLVPLAGRDGRPEELMSLALYAVEERIEEWIRDLAPHKKGYVVVLDAQGDLIAHTGAVPKALEKADGQPIHALSGNDGEAVGTLVLDGREDLLIGGRLATTGFWVWVGMPHAAVYAPLTGLKKPALLALFVCLALGLAGAVQLSRAILTPVEELVGGIRRVGDGVLSHRVPEGRNDELGEAAQAFNRMAERLQRDQLVEEVWRETQRP